MDRPAAFEKAEREHVGPILAEQAAAAGGAFTPPRSEEFEVRGLVVPTGSILT